jgi:ceramide glucosyltransferase
MTPAHTIIVGLATVATAYQIAALLLTRRFFAKRPTTAPSQTAVSLLKPLHGAEPSLATNLASFLTVAHDGPLQTVCGVNHPNDTAIHAVQSLQTTYPISDIALSTGPRAPGANAKIGNLIAMLPLARHDTLILSDSDMAVDHNYLSQVLAVLAQPGIGAVTCLYTGRGDTGFWSQLGAAAISYSAMPNMVVGLQTGLAQPCMGSTIALTRTTLDAIGGFLRFADTLADDHAIGAAVAQLGLRVAVPPILLVHAGTERSLGELWRHQLRWAVTIRGVAGAGHWGSLVTHAVPLALIATVIAPLPGGLALIAALATRITLAGQVDRIHERRTAPTWMIPLADCLGFVVFCASLTARNIDWRGQRLTMGNDGRITGRKKHMLKKRFS